ncbi:MAG: HAMP domain-containing protein [Aquabacterium sp.]|nr:HAMP domain-containing protein [Aquabacterium sp.]
MFLYFSKSIVRLFNTVVLTGLAIGLSVFALLVGMYNYDRSMAELSQKASNTVDLTAVSLVVPLWNFDTAALNGILAASFLDVDVVAIQVYEEGKEQPIAEKIRESIAGVSFVSLLKNPKYIVSSSKITRDGSELARVRMVTSTDKVKSLIRYTTILVFGFALVFILLISIFIVILGKRVIQRPINALRNSADRLASGNLDYDIDVSRVDELGSLAKAFDRMRNAIRRKLSDLARLNKTGETMAGIHEQKIALETALKVMQEQTHFEGGSIYLLDSNQTLNLSAVYPERIEGMQQAKSLQVSEGMAGMVAKTGKTVFIPDTSKAQDDMPSEANDRSRALLCVPMMDDKTVFGVMHFEGEAGKVEFDADDEGFALTIARMAVITVKNIHMLKVIEEQNRTLEERIHLRTAELHQKTGDLNNMLQNMRQGIFTITREAFIHPEYSAFLAEIFETDDISNQPACSFLFAGSSVVGDALSQVEVALGSVIGEDAINFEFNSHLLLAEYTKHYEGARSKVLELDWSPVLGSDGIVDKLMVTVRDVTEHRALQLETERQKEQLEVIGQILAISKDKLFDFIDTSYEFLAENKALIENTTTKDPDVIATLFRNMHTVKGNARTYGLSYATDSVHEAETAYSLLRSHEAYVWDQAALLKQLQSVRTRIEIYESTFKEKLSGLVSGAAGADAAVLERIFSVIESINENSPISDLKNSIKQIRNSLAVLRYEKVPEVLKGIISALPSLARQLQKEVPEVDIADSDILLQKEIVPMLRNVFMHVFRNIMDHGLEVTADRITAGKNPKGNIALKVSVDEDQITITIKDDGKGLAIERIRQKAISAGRITADQPVSDNQIAEMVFLPGLSTAAEVTNVSGRGVGMDAVRKFLNKYMGDVVIEFTDAQTTEGFRPFELVISLPKKYAAQQST